MTIGLVTKDQATRLQLQRGSHKFEFVGRRRKVRKCKVCKHEQTWKYIVSRSGWYWWPKAPDTCAKIMVECDECGGCGKMQATCSGCAEPLTTANQSVCDPEGCCKACAKKDGDT